MSFLMGLNETYVAVRSQILLTEPVPSLSKLFFLLLQDEKQRKVGAGKKASIDTSSALAAFGSKPVTLRPLLSPRMVGHNALIVELWGMLLTSAISCTVILLVISSKTKVVNLLQTMLLLMKIMSVNLLLSPRLNIRNWLVY